MAEPRSRLSISKSGDSITLTWVDGTPPFQLIRSADLKAWTNFTNPTMARSKTFDSDGRTAFFQVRERLELLAIDESFSPGTRLVWLVPELE